MYIGFSKTLMRWGGIRIGVGTRAKGPMGLLMLLIFGMVQLCWWMIVGMLWLLYGLGYVLIYLPIKAVQKRSKKEE